MTADEKEERAAKLAKLSKLSERLYYADPKQAQKQEAQKIVAREIFGDDWIETESEHDEELRLGDDGPKLEPVLHEPELRRIGTVKRATSRAHRDQVDRAVGRYVRMNAQLVTAATWLKRYPAGASGLYDREALLKAVAAINQPAATLTPPTGRLSVVRVGVERQARKDIADGKLTLEQLATMPLKKIGQRYRCGNDTASKVKHSILGDPSRK
jgi:hypothetical protein